MAKRHVENAIRSEKGSKDSIVDMIPITHGFEKERILPPHDGIRRKQVEPVLGIETEYNPETPLGHLVDINILQTDPKYADDLRTFAIASWQDADGEVGNGKTVEVATEAIQALVAHMQASEDSTNSAVADGGHSIRTVLSENFGVVPDAVEDRLLNGDPVNSIRSAAFTLESHPKIETQPDYGPIKFRNEAYRYALTEHAVALYEK